MVFKSTAYRLGYGKNIFGEYLDGKFVIYYKTRDNIVKSKEIFRRAGRVELKKGDKQFNASSVLPIGDGFILSRSGREIKSIKNVEGE